MAVSLPEGGVWTLGRLCRARRRVNLCPQRDAIDRLSCCLPVDSSAVAFLGIAGIYRLLVVGAREFRPARPVTSYLACLYNTLTWQAPSIFN